MDHMIVVPLAGMFTGVVITGMVVLGPVGRSIGEAIRYWLAGGHRRKDLPADLDEVIVRLDDLSRQVGEIAERQDFAERLLSRGRERSPGEGAD